MNNNKISLNNLMPREKLIKFGPEILDDYELLAIILRTGTLNKNVLDLSKEILEMFNVGLVSRKTYLDLLKFKGVKVAKASQIVATFEFARRFSNFKIERGSKLLNSNDVYDLIKFDFIYLNLEKVMLVFVDTKNQFIKKEFIHEGSLNYSIIDIRKIIYKILNLEASGFFLLHNHPSGDSSPSNDDIYLTNKLKEACDLINIRFLDHIIVGDDFYSFFDNGEL